MSRTSGTNSRKHSGRSPPDPRFRSERGTSLPAHWKQLTFTKTPPFSMCSCADYPAFTVASTHSVPSGAPTNIIFASSVKPDIRFRDAISNHVEIVSNADRVLIYDRPVGAGGLRWRELQAWWMAKQDVELLKPRKDDASGAPLLEVVLGRAISRSPTATREATRRFQRRKAANLTAFLRCAGAICRFSDPGNDEEDALWVAFEEDVAVGWR